VRPPDPRLLSYLSAYDRGITDLAVGLRAMVLEEAPDAIEVIWDAYSAVAIGFSFTGKLKDQFCHIASYARHVNLGFDYGATLPDPQKVLAGTGTRIRHIKVASLKDLAKPYLRTYVRAALEQAGGPGAEPVPGPKTIVKGSYPKKRRPA
jgi:hypothetical protein